MKRIDFSTSHLLLKFPHGSFNAGLSMPDSLSLFVVLLWVSNPIQAKLKLSRRSTTSSLNVNTFCSTHTFCNDKNYSWQPVGTVGQEIYINSKDFSNNLNLVPTKSSFSSTGTVRFHFNQACIVSQLKSSSFSLPIKTIIPRSRWATLPHLQKQIIIAGSIIWINVVQSNWHSKVIEELCIHSCKTYEPIIKEVQEVFGQEMHVQLSILDASGVKQAWWKGHITPVLRSPSEQEGFKGR